MLWKTHLAFGFLLGLLARHIVGGNVVIYFFLVLLGSLLPDIDHPSSYISHRVKPLSRVVTFLVKHRGIVHSLWLAGGVSFLVWAFWAKQYGIALFIGYLSHLLGDGLTKQGINFLHPFAQLRVAGFIETGKITEHVTFGVILVLIWLQLIS